MWKRELRKNKIYAVLFVLLGALSVLIEYDATFFVFAMMLGIPLFFSKENWITEVGEVEIIEVDSSIGELVEECGGYCPCAVVRTVDTKCMCREFLEQETAGVCQCGRFEKVGYICE